MTGFTTGRCIVAKNVTSTKDNANMFDIKPLLELLHVNNDTNVQVKLFSTLSAYIMTNEESRDIIITYNSLYDKVCAILTNCPPRSATIMFNFLSALLYAVDEDNSKRKSLIVYSKNMIRSSGCLATMCDLFTSCMMHQDVWRSLCRCVAETCRGVEANQSYCTHLIPTCIQKCSQRNIEVFSVLQSLLHNHARNINLFLECNGMSLFQRQYLQHDDCLQLLSILVQSSPQAVQLTKQSDVSQNMRDFLRVYGGETQLGQWATIILYYISDDKGTADVPSVRNEAIEKEQIDKIINKSLADNDNLLCSTDTTRLFQNVMKEIIQCGAPSDLKYLQGLFPAPPNQINKPPDLQGMLFQNNPHVTEIYTSKHNLKLNSNFTPRPQDDDLVRNDTISLSIPHDKTHNSTFSFIQNQKRSTNETLNYNTANQNTASFHKTVYTKVHSNKVINSTRRTDTRTIIREKTPEILTFKPKFASTPKKINLNNDSKLNTGLLQNSTYMTTHHSIRKRGIRRRVVKKIVPKRLQQSKIDKENKHRSLSGWFFETINESCTTLVKTVRNIFRPKASEEETENKSLSATSDNNSSSCSFSFTNYMRKRDAILKNECTKKSPIGFEDLTMEFSNSCHTCNDTIALRHKLANDEDLKQTVRKLKLGINLYGCDFKKISKQLWPQQTYMTPVVLYNLYRKLLIK